MVGNGGVVVHFWLVEKLWNVIARKFDGSAIGMALKITRKDPIGAFWQCIGGVNGRGRKVATKRSW